MILENDKEYLILEELPGFSSEDIKLDKKGGTLLLSANRNFPYYTTHKHVFSDFINVELFCKRGISRTFSLPDDHGEIKTNFKNGLLEIKVLKRDNTINIPIT